MSRSPLLLSTIGANPPVVHIAPIFGTSRRRRRTLGRPIEVADAQIAAVCLVHDATLATRNTDDFEGLGLALIDPWRE